MEDIKIDDARVGIGRWYPNVEIGVCKNFYYFSNEYWHTNRFGMLVFIAEVGFKICKFSETVVNKISDALVNQGLRRKHPHHAGVVVDKMINARFGSGINLFFD